MKLTVKEYASKFKISAQAVYQKINKGVVKCKEENGKKYIIVDEAEIKQLEQVSTNPFQLEHNPFTNDFGSFVSKELKHLLKQNKAKDRKIEQLEKKLFKKIKEIKKLNKQLVQSVENEKHTLLSFINEQKKLLEHKAEEPIDVEVKKSKKKGKKKKGKK